MHPILFKIPLPGGGSLPLYSYGVMLGLSFIVGWYLTLGLAERDGLPRETMANCYVVTALSAVVFSRLLYVLTNLEQFQSFGQIFEIRSGGMVAYGGFLGGFVGSWGFLAWKKIPLIPWADVAVPSLASGLWITRIGCYLYGCDFGQPLAETSPPWLKKMGTFPHWTEELADKSQGSPAWAQHVADGRIDDTATASLPVHPTQIYESLVGLGLLVILLLARKNQKFRGQIFLYFTFLYGAARFALEFLRDDKERGDIPPALPSHILFSLCLAGFAVAYALWIAPIIKQSALRLLTQVAAFIPAVWAFVAFKPAAFQSVAVVKLSTSQFIGLTSAIGAALGFSMLYKSALANPKAAMAPFDFGPPPEPRGPEEEEAASPPPRPPKKAAVERDDAPEEKPRPSMQAAPPRTGAKKKRKKPAPPPPEKEEGPADEAPPEERSEEERSSG